MGTPAQEKIMMYRRLWTAISIFVLSMSPAMRADVIWGTLTHTAPSTPPGEQAVLLTPGTTGTFMGGSTYTILGTTSITGATVSISTNNDDSSGIDQLYANTAIQLYANPLGSSDTSIDQLTVTVVGNTFNDIYMNLFGAFTEAHSGALNDSVSFMVTTNDGTFTHVFTGLTDDNTDNWIFLTTTNGETITSVTLSDTRFYALQDLHVSGVTATPEPASLLMLGSGATCLLGWFRRRQMRPR
jgi:hypothetical protein